MDVSLVHLKFGPLNSSRRPNYILNYQEMKVNTQTNPFQLPIEVKYDKRQPLDLSPFGNKIFIKQGNNSIV